MRAVSGVFGWVLSIALFAGYSLLELASGNDAKDLIGDAWVDRIDQNKLLIGIVLAAVFALQQAWLRWPRPATPGQLVDLKHTIEAFLGIVMNQYLKSVNDLDHTPVAVRANIMLPTWPRFRIGRKYLKIYYFRSEPPGGFFPESERGLRWYRGNGTCGWAWKENSAVPYDSVNPNYHRPKHRLSAKQLRIVGSIRSVLSVPIWKRDCNKVVGVFNLDSSYNVDRTLFDREEIVRAVASGASVLAGLLFDNGVKPK